MVRRGDVEQAWARIRGHIRVTPVFELARGDLGVPGETVLKLEYLQRTGSFKARGALNFLAEAGTPAGGIVAASGGNHAAAVVFAASVAGVRPIIFMPETTPPAKIERVRAFGADIRLIGRVYADAHEAAMAHVAAAAEAGGAGVVDLPAYDDPRVIAGQGTVALEMESQTGFDTLLVAVGGGGLAAGCAAALDGGARLVAVETAGTACLRAALTDGAAVDVEVSGVCADSLGARRIGALPFAILRDRIDRSLVIDDAAVLEAQSRLWREARIAVEPGGAAAFAALISGAYRPDPGERVGVILCGGNVDPSRLAG